MHHFASSQRQSGLIPSFPPSLPLQITSHCSPDSCPTLPCKWCFCHTVQVQPGGPFPPLPPLPGTHLSRLPWVNGSCRLNPSQFCTPGWKTPPVRNSSHETRFSSSSAGTQKNHIPLTLTGPSCYEQYRGRGRLKPRTFAYKAFHKIITLLKGFSKLSLSLQWTLLEPPLLSGHSL